MVNAGSVPAEEFRALADLLAAAPPKVCFGQLSIMQLGYAAATALEGTAAARWTRLAQLEEDIVHLSANGGILLVLCISESRYLERLCRKCLVACWSMECIGDHIW